MSTEIAGLLRIRREPGWDDEPFDGRPTKCIFCVRPEAAKPFWAATPARRAHFRAVLDAVKREQSSRSA